MGRKRLAEVLKQVDEKVGEGTLPIVVFDLDSTLFSTRSRNLQILTEFAEEVKDDTFRTLVGQVQASEFRYDPIGPFRARGYDDESVLNDAMNFWKDRFFTDEYLLHDTPWPGAVSYTTAVHDRGGFVYYLTGRHVGGMEVGTIKALTQAGFPYWRGRTTLHLKPNFEMPDKAYKHIALGDLRSHHGEVVATFENEPGNANLFLNAFPEALHFLLNTEHSPTAEPPDPKLIKVDDFQL